MQRSGKSAKIAAKYLSVNLSCLCCIVQWDHCSLNIMNNRSYVMNKILSYTSLCNDLSSVVNVNLEMTTQRHCSAEFLCVMLLCPLLTKARSLGCVWHHFNMVGTENSSGPKTKPWLLFQVLTQSACVCLRRTSWVNSRGKKTHLPWVG